MDAPPAIGTGGDPGPCRSRSTPSSGTPSPGPRCCSGGPTGPRRSATADQPTAAGFSSTAPSLSKGLCIKAA